MNKLLKVTLLASSLALALTACKSDDDEPGKGELSIAITDAPIDEAEAVVVQFTGIEIQGQGERHVFDFSEAKTIDLLQLTGDESLDLLDDIEMDAGEYQWIRLKVNALQGVTDSYIDINSARYPLYIPSGSQTGLKLNRPFVVAAGSSTNLTIDFDLRKSVHQPQNNNGDYMLRPTLRLVDNNVVGHIDGIIPADLLNATGCSSSSAVYLFEGMDAEVDDIDGNEPEPVTTSMIELNEFGEYEFEIGFVNEGDYTLAFTCEAGNDDPETDDSISFTTVNATVTARDTVSVDF